MNTEYQYFEGRFLIDAPDDDTFHERRRKLEELTGFGECMDGVFERDEDEPVNGEYCYTLIATCGYKSTAEMKAIITPAVAFMPWLLWSDCDVYLDGKEVYSHGKWLDKTTSE